MRLRLFLQALFFTLLVTAPEFFEVIRFHGLSPKSFSDWDEPYYFPIALQNGRALLEWFNGKYPGRNLPFEFLVTGPHEFIAAVVGTATYLLGIPLTVLGLALDFICSFFSFIFFALLFRSLGLTESRAATATIVTLFFPWLLYIPQFIHIPVSLGANVASIPHALYPCQPIVRGLSTQLSYPFFGLTLLLGVRASNARNNILLLIAGLFAGYLIYFYLFSWPAAVALVTLFIILGPLTQHEKVSQLVYFHLGALLASLPGLYGLYLHFLPAVSSAGPAASNQLNDALWYFSIEQFVLLLLLALWLNRDRNNALVRMSVAALIAEFLLMNTQKLVGVHTAPYHFPLLYLNPVLSGALFTALLLRLKNFELKYLPNVLLGSAMVFLQIGQAHGYLSVTADTNEFVSLVSEIKLKVPEDGHVMYPPSDNNSKSSNDRYHFFTIPYWVRALSSRPLFAEFVGGDISGTMPQNLLSGWIYLGTLQPYVPCPKSLPQLPGDILSGMMTREYWARYYACQEIPKFLETHPLCKLLQKNPFEFVVWQHSVVTEIPAHSKELLESIWRSDRGEYELFRFNRAKALESSCGATEPQ